MALAGDTTDSGNSYMQLLQGYSKSGKAVPNLLTSVVKCPLTDWYWPKMNVIGHIPDNCHAIMRV